MKIFSNHRRKLDPHRRYGSKEFKNKLWAAKNYKREASRSFFAKTGLSQVGVAAGVLLVGVIFYFLVLSPYFLVTQVTVAGNSQVQTDQIRELLTKSDRRFMLVPQNSLFLLGSGKVSDLIRTNYPLVREVKSKRGWPNRIAVEIAERAPALNFSVNGKHYLVDDHGFVVGELENQGSQLLVTDQVEEEVYVGETLDGKLVPFIISMQKLWATKFPGNKIVEVRIPGKGSAEASFVTSEGWSALFSTDRPGTNQLSNLVLLLNKQIPAAERPKLAYIDLRLAKWAYYCFKSTPCQQTETETAGSNVTN